MFVQQPVLGCPWSPFSHCSLFAALPGEMGPQDGANTRKAWRRHKERKDSRLTCKDVRQAATTCVCSALVLGIMILAAERELCLYVQLQTAAV